MEPPYFFRRELDTMEDIAEELESDGEEGNEALPVEAANEKVFQKGVDDDATSETGSFRKGDDDDATNQTVCFQKGVDDDTTSKTAFFQKGDDDDATNQTGSFRKGDDDDATNETGSFRKGDNDDTTKETVSFQKGDSDDATKETVSFQKGDNDTTNQTGSFQKGDNGGTTNETVSFRKGDSDDAASETGSYPKGDNNTGERRAHAEDDDNAPSEAQASPFASEDGGNNARTLSVAASSSGTMSWAEEERALHDLQQDATARESLRVDAGNETVSFVRGDDTVCDADDTHKAGIAGNPVHGDNKSETGSFIEGEDGGALSVPGDTTARESLCVDAGNGSFVRGDDTDCEAGDTHKAVLAGNPVYGDNKSETGSFIEGEDGGALSVPGDKTAPETLCVEAGNETVSFVRGNDTVCDAEYTHKARLAGNPVRRENNTSETASFVKKEAIIGAPRDDTACRDAGVHSIKLSHPVRGDNNTAGFVKEDEENGSASASDTTTPEAERAADPFSEFDILFSEESSDHRERRAADPFSEFDILFSEESSDHRGKLAAAAAAAALIEKERLRKDLQQRIVSQNLNAICDDDDEKAEEASASSQGELEDGGGGGGSTVGTLDVVVIGPGPSRWTTSGAEDPGSRDTDVARDVQVEATPGGVCRTKPGGGESGRQEREEPPPPAARDHGPPAPGEKDGGKDAGQRAMERGRPGSSNNNSQEEEEEETRTGVEKTEAEMERHRGGIMVDVITAPPPPPPPLPPPPHLPPRQSDRTSDGEQRAKDTDVFGEQKTKVDCGGCGQPRVSEKGRGGGGGKGPLCADRVVKINGCLSPDDDDDDDDDPRNPIRRLCRASKARRR